ncbi:MAG: HAMP domain-containing sensor histidine kinase [Actinomycetota bacterium]
MQALFVVLGSLVVVLVLLLVGVRRRLAAAEILNERAVKVLGSGETGSQFIDDLKQAMEEADGDRERAVSLEAVIRGATVGIVLFDQSGSTVCSNEFAEGLLAGDGEQALLRARTSTLAQRVSLSGRAEEIEVDLYDPNRRILRVRAMPVPGSGRGRSVALYLEDLSLERRVEAMRSDFVANASHELKTPLGALSLLAETLSDSENEEQRARLAKRLRDEAARMSNVIDDVVQLAETQSLGAEFSPVEIRAVMKEAVDSVNTVAESKSIQIIAGDVADVVVNGSREQLVSAVRNLLHNAITYTAIGGEGGLVTYRAVINGPGVCVEIEDTGIGIPSRYLDRVFERFFRVDRARSRASGGTGLGLSIVKNVALAHGGKVGVDSEVGVGSTFRMCLPMIEDS